MLRSCPPVVVATPGRLWDLITHGTKHLSRLDDLSFFVLDEADRMVQQVRWCTNMGGGANVCMSLLGTSRLHAYSKSQLSSGLICAKFHLCFGLVK